MLQSATASYGIHVTNRTRMSRPTPPITKGVVFPTSTRLGLGTCHCERYISSSGLRPIGTPDDATTIQSATASHGIHVTNRTRMSRPTPPITNDAVPRNDFVSSDTGAGLVYPPQGPGSLTGPGSKGQARAATQSFGLGHLAQATPTLGFGHPDKPRRITLRVNCGMRCTHSARTMVCRTTLRVIM